jgi:hypothetical protein
MKNANIFIDVDLTLVDAKGKLFEGAREQVFVQLAHQTIWGPVLRWEISCGMYPMEHVSKFKL